MRRTIEDLKRTIVFLAHAKDDGSTAPVASSFLIQLGPVFMIVTAKHVVVRGGKKVDDQLVAALNSTSGTIVLRSLATIKSHYGVDWAFHPREDVDIAVMPFGVGKDDDVRVIGEDLFRSAKGLHELLDVFFLSFQPGVQFKSRITPVIRSGKTSVFNEDGSFFIDAAAFPGNSGSPVMLTPTVIRWEDNGSVSLVGGTRVGLVGVVGAYLPYREVAVSKQTGRDRVVFEENTGLSQVWPVDFLQEILNQEKLKKQLQDLSTGHP